MEVCRIRPVLGPGTVLATAGVLLTAVGTGLILYLLIGHREGLTVGVTTCLLLASTMSSTDSASVFSILRGKGLNLKHNLRPTLELESGSNDPMACVLTTTLIGLVLQGGNPDYGSETLRLVRIGDYDLCACVGTHVQNTAEIGHFKILSHDYNADTHTWRMRFKLVE